MEFFDEVYGYNCQRRAHSFYPSHLWHNREKVPLDGKTYSHDLIMQAALDFIRDNKDEPFFTKTQPQEVRYEKQLKEKGIPDWQPPKL